MQLFTFIMDFIGGTYVSQVSSGSWETAPSAWTKHLNPNNIQGMNEEMVDLLREEIAQETPALLTDLSNVWCVSATLRGKPVLVHFVATNG